MLILYDRTARSVMHAALLCAIEPAAEPMLRQEFQKGLRIDEAGHESIYKFSQTCRSVMAQYPAAGWLRFSQPMQWLERALFFAVRSKSEDAIRIMFEAIQYALEHGINALTTAAPPGKALRDLISAVAGEVRHAVETMRLVPVTDGRTRYLIGRYSFRNDVADLVARQLLDRHAAHRVVVLDRQRAVVAESGKTWVEHANVYASLMDRPDSAKLHLTRLRAYELGGPPAVELLPKIPRRCQKWLRELAEL